MGNTEDVTEDDSWIQSLPDDVINAVPEAHLSSTNDISLHDNVIQATPSTEQEAIEGPVMTIRKEQLVQDEDLQKILHSMQTSDKIKNRWKFKWQDKTIRDVRQVLSTAEKLNSLITAQLDIIIQHTKPHQEQGNLLIRNSWSKVEKVNALSYLFGDGTRIEKETYTTEMLSLSVLSAKALSKKKSPLTKVPSRDVLNVVAAKLMYPKALKEWEFDSTIKCNSVEGVPGNISFFSYPEYNEMRNKLEPKCWDGDHLLVNLRCRVCTEGLSGWNISKEAWHAVCELKNPNPISPALVKDLIDRQSNSNAQKTFSTGHRHF